MMNMNMSPFELLGLLKNRNPEELAMSMIENNNIQDPMINQVVQFARSGNVQDLTKMAENIFAKNGKNFSQEFASFMKMLN